MFQWDQTRVRVKKCALFCWMDHHVGAFIHVFFDWQNQTDACAVDHVITWYQAIHMINKYVVLNGFLKSNYASSWLRGASVGQWSLSLNSFKWDDCMFQKMRWWMNMWHQTLPRPSDVNADSSVFVCSSELSQFIHQSYERLNILRQYHCGSNQMHFILSHLDQIGVLSCDSAGFIVMASGGSRNFEPGALRLHHEARNGMNVFLLIWVQVRWM